jgi:hypothetical protein
MAIFERVDFAVSALSLVDIPVAFSDILSTILQDDVTWLLSEIEGDED